MERLNYCYCDVCEKETDTYVKEVEETFQVKEEQIKAIIHVRICKTCGNEVLDEELEKENEATVYKIYRERKGLLLPEEIKERSKANVLECFPTGDGQLICMFGDNSVRKVDLVALKEQYKNLIHVLRNRRLLDHVKVGVGGYSVVFDDSVEVTVEDLKRAGKELPLSAEDFYGFVQRNVVDATQVCNMMQCSRQNLSYLVKEEKIAPIIAGTTTNLYTRGAVEHMMND